MSGLLDPLAYGLILSSPEKRGGESGPCSVTPGGSACSAVAGGAGVARDQAPGSLGWSQGVFATGLVDMLSPRLAFLLFFS